MYKFIFNDINVATNGWYPICWAFLKPGDGKHFTNIDIRCSLQLHYYQRIRSKRGIFDEWKAQKRMYVRILLLSCLFIKVFIYKMD